MQADPAKAAGREEMESQLRTMIDAQLAEARKESGPANQDLVFKRPYFYKQYYEYPGDSSVYSLDFTEVESRTTPLTAELEVEKTRFATRFNEDRDEVQADSNFYRSKGIDYVSYELRSGSWRKVGELFLAESTEENVGGEWRQVLERQRPRAVIVDEPTRWFDRLKFWKRK